MWHNHSYVRIIKTHDVCQPEYVHTVARAHNYTSKNYVMYVHIECFTLNVSFVGIPFEKSCGYQSSWVHEVYLYMTESHDDMYHSK